MLLWATEGRLVAMPRKRTIDLILLWTLLPIWAMWWSFNVYQVVNGRVVSWPIWTLPPGAAQEYPVVFGIDPRWKGSGGLTVGDELIRLGGIDLRGASWPRVGAVIASEASPTGDLAAAVRRSGSVLDLSLDVKV